MIKLGSWQPGDDPLIPTKKGYGYRPGMTEDALFDSTRVWWRVSLDQIARRDINHAVAVVGGVTRAIYSVESWSRRGSTPERSGFAGARLYEGAAFDEYVGPCGKRVEFRPGAQAPIMYWPPARKP